MDIPSLLVTLSLLFPAVVADSTPAAPHGSAPTSLAPQGPVLPKNVVENSPDIFVGRVVALGERNISSLDNKPSYAIVHIEKIYNGTDSLIAQQTSKGQDVTIDLINVAGVQAQTSYIFGAKPWFTAEHIALTEVGHVLAAPPPKVSQISGTVSRVNPKNTGTVVTVQRLVVASSIQAEPSQVPTKVLLPKSASVKSGSQITVDVSSLQVRVPTALPAAPSQEIQQKRQINSIRADQDRNEAIAEAASAVSVVIAHVGSVLPGTSSDTNSLYEHKPIVREAKVQLLRNCRGTSLPTKASVFFVDAAASKDKRWETAPALATGEVLVLMLRSPPAGISLEVGQLGVFEQDDVLPVSDAATVCPKAKQ
jgi:hypothetical protein